jgi:CRP-like cAMP-binding protein
MLQLMSHFRRQQDTELEHRNTQNAPQRIGCFLLRLCKPDATDSVVLYLPYDKNLVASRLGMQPETFSRALNKLKEKTDIIINGATITIPSLEKIIHFSCSACSSHFPCQDLS